MITKLRYWNQSNKEFMRGMVAEAMKFSGSRRAERKFEKFIMHFSVLLEGVCQEDCRST